MNCLKKVKVRVLNVKKLKYPRNTDTLYIKKKKKINAEKLLIGATVQIFA